MRLIGFNQLELIFSSLKQSHYSGSLVESPLHPFFEENLKGRVFELKPTDGKKLSLTDELPLMENSDLEKRLIKEKIPAIILDTHSSFAKEKWAKKHGFRLIVPAWRFQKKLEDKIFFDRFLQKNKLPVPRSAIITNAVTFKKWSDFPAVFQVPKSDGSKGTFFVNNKKELDLLSKKHHFEFPILWREWITEGLPLGVTLVIGKTATVISALRMQAVFNHADRTDYYGVQWLPTSRLSKKSTDNLNSVLNTMADALRKMSYRGVANFDLILKDGQPYFIECNPRLGGATPLLTWRKDLLHGEDFIDLFARSLTDETLPDNMNFIPDHDYEGFNLDLDFFAAAHKKQKMAPPYPVGFCDFENNKIIYKGLNTSFFHSKSSFFIYHNLPQKTNFSEDRFYGFIMMHSPLLNSDKKHYYFSESGKKRLDDILAYLTTYII